MAVEQRAYAGKSAPGKVNKFAVLANGDPRKVNPAVLANGDPRKANLAVLANGDPRKANPAVLANGDPGYVIGFTRKVCSNSLLRTKR